MLRRIILTTYSFTAADVKANEKNVNEYEVIKICII